MSEQQLSGSCLCGETRYSVQGDQARFFHCHCSRCRKATGTGHGSNVILNGTLEWTAGDENVREYKVPDAKRFRNVFCTQCGSRLPSLVPEMGIVVVPAGSLDQEPTFESESRIFYDSRTSWSCGDKHVETFGEYPQ